MDLTKTGAGIATSATGHMGGFLRCGGCGRREQLTRDRIGFYYANGWPKCCVGTMTWWTQRQIDAGEAP